MECVCRTGGNKLKRAFPRVAFLAGPFVSGNIGISDPVFRHTIAALIFEGAVLHQVGGQGAARNDRQS